MISVDKKQCTKCLKHKTPENFSKTSRNKDGLKWTCKACDKLWRIQNKEKIAVIDKKWYEKNKARRQASHKKWKEKNPERMRELRQNWELSNKEKSLQSKEKWRLRNMDKVREASNKRNKKRYHTDTLFRCEKLMRSMFYRVISDGKTKKTNSVVKLLGYSALDLFNHFSEKLKSGMSWDNHGDWHIDHIKPVSQFISEGITDPAIINALNNLQPLWAADNMSKGCKYAG